MGRPFRTSILLRIAPVREHMILNVIGDKVLDLLK
jgi:hypothetical protein